MTRELTTWPTGWGDYNLRPRLRGVWEIATQVRSNFPNHVGRWNRQAEVGVRGLREPEAAFKTRAFTSTEHETGRARAP
jgi:hypothetical protein